MARFKLKGNKQSSIPIKWEDKKIHLEGGREYDSDKIPLPGGAISIPFEEVQKQLGSNILEHEYDKEKPELIKKIEELKRENQELTETLKRLQAEFENYKKWNAKEKTEFVKYAHADMIEKMLPVLDSFEIALKNTNDKEKFVEGMKMIYEQFHSMLEAEGLRPIKTNNEKFDPYKHEVLMKEDSDKPDETILEEFQKGYMLNDKVLRHSKVKVSGK